MVEYAKLREKGRLRESAVRLCVSESDDPAGPHELDRTSRLAMRSIAVRQSLFDFPTDDPLTVSLPVEQTLWQKYPVLFWAASCFFSSLRPCIGMHGRPVSDTSYGTLSLCCSAVQSQKRESMRCA